MNKQLRDSYSPYRVVFLMLFPAIISALFAYYAWDMGGALGAIIIQISILLIIKFSIDRKVEKFLGEISFSEHTREDYYDSYIIYKVENPIQGRKKPMSEYDKEEWWR